LGEARAVRTGNSHPTIRQCPLVLMLMTRARGPVSAPGDIPSRHLN